jgi:hypothetical protein
MKQLMMGILCFTFCTLARADTGRDPVVTLTVGEVIGYLAGILTFFLAIMGFFVRRTIFQEIDLLKEGKQDKAMCDQIEGVASRDREEIKSDLKDGKREFKLLHQKIDRIMWALKLPPQKKDDDENGI